MPALPYAHPELHEPQHQRDWRGFTDAALDAVFTVGLIAAALITIHPHGAGRDVFPLLLAVLAITVWNDLVDVCFAWRGDVAQADQQFDSDLLAAVRHDVPVDR